MLNFNIEYWILNIDISFEYWIWMFDLNILRCLKWTFCCIRASLGVSEWALVVITEGTMLSPIDILFEFSSLGTSEWSDEVINEVPLLVFKYISKESDKLWTIVGSPELKCDGIKEDQSDENI